MKRSLAFLLALGIIALLAWNSGGFFFQRPYYEYWDSAANSINVLQAKHFQQLYGPYSRYLFSHPGPAFFYVYALGEWIFFDVLHVVPSPVQGQLLINLCLVTGFYVASLSMFAHWLPARRRWAFLWAALFLGILHFGLMKDLPSYDVLDGPSAFLSVWPIHPMVLPFLCLLTAGASVGAGRGKHLPLLVLAGGFLTVHVGQPIFIGPTAMVAYGGLVLFCAARQRAAAGGYAAPERSARRGWLLAAWREFPRAHVVAGILLFLFLLPMLIDLTLGRDSNFAAILQHMHDYTVGRRSVIQTLAFFLMFGAYTPYQPGRIDFGHYDTAGLLAYLRVHTLFYVFWLCVLVLVLQAPLASLRTWSRRRSAPSVPDPMDGTRRFLTWATLLTALNTAISLYWAMRKDGLMYYYLSWCNFAMYYCAALIAVSVLLTRGDARATAPGAEPLAGASGAKRLAARLAGVGVLILTGFLFADRLRIHEYDPEGLRSMHAQVARAMADSDARHPGTRKVIVMPDPHWTMAAAAGLQLARAGEPFVVSAGRWKNVFDSHYLWQSQRGKSMAVGLCPWYVMTIGQTRTGVPANAPAYPLPNDAELMLTPPTLKLSAPGSTADLNFVLNGNAGVYVLAGWAATEEFGTWSESPWAALAVHPQVVQGTNVELLLSGAPFLSPPHGLTRQRVRFYFNGMMIGPEQQLAAEGTLRFVIPAATWNGAASKVDAQASLAFEFPDAVAPAKLDPKAPNPDSRALGVFFHNVSLRVTGNAEIEHAIAAAEASRPATCKMLSVPQKYRTAAMDVGSYLARAGAPFVAQEGWKDTFGAAHDWHGLNAAVLKNGLVPWYIVPAGLPRRGVPVDAPAFPLADGAQLSLTPPTLELSAAGSTADLHFVRHGNADDYVLAGLADQEPFGTWSEQRWVALAFRPQVVHGTNVEVGVDGIPFLSPSHGLTHQRVRLYFNGTPVGNERQFSTAGSLSFAIPAAAWNAAASKADAQASLAFEFPDAVSPATFDPQATGGDPRELGIFFQQLRLRVAP